MVMRKNILCFVLLSTLILFNGCGTIGKVSESQLRSDIESLDEFQDGYYCRYVNETPFKVKDVKIERRQTTPEDREDYILCNVEAENEHFVAEFVVNMYYDHYDTGGWVLSHGSAEIQNIVPVAAVDAFEIPLISLNPYEEATNLWVELDNTQISDITLENNRCIINYHYVNDILDFKGYSTTVFENGNWSSIDKENFETVDFNVDWSNVSLNMRNESGIRNYFYNWNVDRKYMIDDITYSVSDIDTVDSYNINFTSYDWENRRISGELIIDAGGYYIEESWNNYTREDIILTIPFDTNFDDKTGKFIVYYQDELETIISGSISEWSYGSNRYTTANCHAEITYDFSDDGWKARFFVDSLCNNPIKVKEYTKSVFGFSRT